MSVSVRARRAVPTLVFASLVACTVCAAPSAAATPQEQVEAREKLMKTMGGGMKALTQFIKGEAGGPAEVKKAASDIAGVAAHDPMAVFPKGTAMGVGDSAAKPALWDNWSKAAGLWGDLKTASTGLVQAADTGDKAKVAAATQAVGKVCQSCHEDFRQKKE
ncbi:cytochrome c556 [Azospirillum fermentarium]|uniref:c-type cytochrome n=1 Tax=Azospirillum fermentarium TaxID=1233114 RepID=UPI0022276A54|nr:cytochrome c [Azospirillum fermentarium]MCW2244545.1 cytochrome c556 [Azospirillum fermentarium]